MATLLPTDLNDNPIPAIRLKSGGAHSISSGASSTRNSTAFETDTKVISLYATEDVYVKCGNSSVTATASDHFFPKGVYYDLAIAGEGTAQYTHIAVLQVSTAGTVHISEKE